MLRQKMTQQDRRGIAQIQLPAVLSFDPSGDPLENYCTERFKGSTVG